MGKTYFSGSAKKAVILDIELGSTSAKNQEIDVVPIHSVADFRDSINYLKKDKEYDTVITDSLTRYSEKLYVVIKSIYPEISDSMKVWLEFDVAMRTKVDELLSLDKNVIMNCLVEDVVTESGFVQKYPFIKSSKFKQMLTSFFDLVLYFDIEDGRRCYRTVSTDKFVAKNRLSNIVKLPEVVYGDEELFDVQKLMDYIKSELEKQSVAQ